MHLLSRPISDVKEHFGPNPDEFREAFTKKVFANLEN